MRNYLVDTHVLLWTVTAMAGGRLSAATDALLADSNNTFYVSSASIWECAIKFALGRADFSIPPNDLNTSALQSGMRKLPISSEHAIGVADLPAIHSDPFDRLLISQAIHENLIFLTIDREILTYPAPLTSHDARK